jgi:hypothetical protein
MDIFAQPIADRKALIEILKELNRIELATQKASAVNLQDVSPARAKKIGADADWRGMERTKLEHRAHVLCVDLGLAKMEDPKHYAESTLSPSSFHTYRWIKEQPRRLKGVAA